MFLMNSNDLCKTREYKGQAKNLFLSSGGHSFIYRHLTYQEQCSDPRLRPKENCEPKHHDHKLSYSRIASTRPRPTHINEKDLSEAAGSDYELNDL